LANRRIIWWHDRTFYADGLGQLQQIGCWNGIRTKHPGNIRRRRLYSTGKLSRKKSRTCPPSTIKNRSSLIFSCSIYILFYRFPYILTRIIRFITAEIVNVKHSARTCFCRLGLRKSYIYIQLSDQRFMFAHISLVPLHLQ